MWEDRKRRGGRERGMEEGRKKRGGVRALRLGGEKGAHAVKAREILETVKK